ncbi:MAG: glutathione binding-like protein, partial [Leucothrix sp.]
EIGPQVRLLSYHTLLDHRNIILPMMTQDCPWYSSVMMKAGYPKMASAMRHLMKINVESAEEAKQKISTALDNLTETLGDREFLVGESFTRADLSVAALLAPLLMPQGYGVDWPEKVPEPLAGQIKSFQGRLGWVGHIYDNFR